MKTGGIILIVLGALNLIVAIAGMADYPDQAGPKFGFAIGMIVLGAYLINRAQKKKEEKLKKEKWENQEE